LNFTRVTNYIPVMLLCCHRLGHLGKKERARNCEQK
jgi:hypothetical protein